MPFAHNQQIRIHYELEGQGPPLMLMHGFTMTTEDWREYGYVAGLRAHYTLILVDARGNGASDKPGDPDAYLWEPLVGDVAAVLDHLQLKQAHYWGWSWGGALGYALAHFAPERLNTLIFGGSSAPLARDPDRRPSTMLKLLEDGGAAAMVDLWKQHLSISPEHEARLLALDMPALKAERRALRTGLDTVPPSINQPCLLYVGESEEDYPGMLNESQRMPDAKFVSFPGFNHFDMWAHSDVVLPHVLEFLNAH